MLSFSLTTSFAFLISTIKLVVGSPPLPSFNSSSSNG
nr:MAG TPA: hypothetical protein [Caudoviricetes sp.]